MRARAIRAAPGMATCVAIASLATVIGHQAPIIGGAVLAILIGILLRNTVGLPAGLAPGVSVASKSVLQIAVALLGAGLSLRQVWSTGTGTLVVLLGTLVLGIPAILALGRLLGIDRTLRRLIAVGTGICGASAIGALTPILAAEADVTAYAIATVFLFNIIAVLSFPPIGRLLGLSAHGFGLWAGTAINDTSSVIAASYSFSPTAGAYAVIVKLARTLMIVPVSLIFATLVARERRSELGRDAVRVKRAPLPKFILWFMLACTLNTFGLLGPIGRQQLPAIGQFLIVVALAGVGLSADLRAMARTGVRPIFLGLAGWMIIATLSLGLQHLAGSI